MPPYLKLIFYSPWILVSMIKIALTARKHRRFPDALPNQKRNDLILKTASKVLKIYNINVVIKGKENLVKAPSLIIANHVNNVDVLAILKAMMKDTHDKSVDHNLVSFVSKIELQRKSLIRNSVKLLDGQFIDRDKYLDAWKKVKAFGEMIKSERKIGVIFPEGTRSKDGQIGEFKKGAFRIAKMNLLPIIPTTINYSNVGLDAKNKKATVEIIFAKPIRSDAIMTLSDDDLMKNTRAVIVSNFITGDKHE
ncbi:lysophospholipid acyltransferase family protein [Mycoplasmopsis agassizii]|uniref:1-acyl-sn-glycerol-3-phosphate acyltransferase n=1 Tax=Mycoplasmopsis agassizii TaxID=33922 RepID=A0A1W1X275_9BACT|nr:lysophospholipid acyltransferase family protein [Mycoplasmopsis agassizii]PAF55501.1 1-acyl-sn-glycerol-3-phosphate acyltransferase [Mycoplasmopsis agassizii]PAK21556.1 1-acyl-sn-glycerol-3-phosphate acyltransferase [Mycoplasmopsis agassizii]SMC18042.1 1-acyl-sn-glycerol-3-phosphate acyltransferase [Mycoplasmopsis agassizii]